MTKNKFFKFGYGSDQDNLYALRCMDKNRFVFVGSNLAHLFQIKILQARKQNLQVCQISCAKNYVHNLVDNQSCQNWSTDNHSCDPQKILQAQYLIDSVDAQDCDFEGKKIWAQMTYYYCDFIQNLRQYQKWYHVDDFVRLMLYTELDTMIYDTEWPVFDHSQTQDLKYQIQKFLYYGDDPDQTDKNIMQVILDLGFEPQYQCWLQTQWNWTPEAKHAGHYWSTRN